VSERKLPVFQILSIYYHIMAIPLSVFRLSSNPPAKVHLAVAQKGKMLVDTII